MAHLTHVIKMSVNLKRRFDAKTMAFILRKNVEMNATIDIIYVISFLYCCLISWHRFTLKSFQTRNHIYLHYLLYIYNALVRIRQFTVRHFGCF